MNNFSIYHQLTLKKYKQLAFHLAYRKITYIIITLCGVIMLIFNISLIITQQYDQSSDHYLSLLPILYAIWLPIGLYLGVKKSFSTNGRLYEPMTFHFSSEGVVVTGESFNSKYNWEKVYMVKIINGWLLVYQSQKVANLIKIKNEDEGNINALKDFLKAGNFKIKLKW